MKALVTDTHLRNSLAGLRALGRGGVHVIAAGPGGSAAGLWSRHAAARVRIPDPADDPAAFLSRLREHVAKHGPVVVYPGQEAGIDALIGAEPPLPAEAVLPYPSTDALSALRDKRVLAALAAEAGIATPQTVAEGSAGELGSAVVPVPCAVKPARPGGALATTTLVDSRDELLALLSRLDPGEPLLVQERAAAPLSAVALVMGDDGRTVARFQQVARRTWPRAAGNSSVAVSVPPDEGLVGRAGDMLARVGYVGLAHLQFLSTARGPALIDVNPRFYGSLPLALACGVNLPAAWHAVVTGAPPPQPGSYAAGVAFRWLEGEILAAARGHPRHLFDPPPRPRAPAVWARDDPLPGGVLALALLTGIVSRRLPHRRH